MGALLGGGTGGPRANRCQRSCRAHSLSPTDHQAAFYLALQLAISRQVSPPAPAQRGLGRDLCVRRPRLPGSLSPGMEPSAKARGLARWSADTGRPGPALGGHTRNPEAPGSGGGGAVLGGPRGRQGAPVARSQSPGLSCAAGTPTEGPGRHTRSLGHRPEDAGGARGGDPSLANTEGGEQRLPDPEPPRCPPGRRAVSAFLAAAFCRCLCRAPRGPGASGPVPAGHQCETLVVTPAHFPSAGRRVTQGSAPRTRPSPRQDGPRPRI